MGTASPPDRPGGDTPIQDYGRLAAHWAPGSFLARLPIETGQRLLAVGVRRRFEPGRHLLREGDLQGHVEFLLSGFVKVTTAVGDVEPLMSVRVPGDMIGETAALTGGPRTATVTACGWVSSVVLSKDEFHRFLSQHPQAGVILATTMSERLTWANQRRGDFAAYPSEVRLARLLLALAKLCGIAAEDGITFGLALSQPELATMVGVAEPTAQKAIRDLRRAGVLRTGYRRITIVDHDGLRRFAQDEDL